MARPTITEAQLRQIVQEEMVLRALQEGVWDDVKAGAQRLRALAAKKFGQAAAQWGQTIQDKLSKMQMPDDVKVAISALKQGMKESGESIQMDDTLTAAKELGTMNKEKALAVVEQDFEGPVHDLAKQLEQQGPKAEARHYATVYAALLEHPDVREPLNEFGFTSALGVGLALLGGVPMLFKGLEKLAHALHFQNMAQWFQKAEHVAHAIEVKTINAVVPNKLSYAAYKFLHSKGLKFSKEKKEMLSYDEFTSDADGSHSMKQVNGLLYKALLIYFAFNGFVGLFHAGASMIGAVEGAATTVKGIELARGATEIAALMGKSA
jgi:hypothetical protein